MRGVINQPCLFPEVHVIHRLWWASQAPGLFVMMNKAQFQRKYGMAAARFPHHTIGASLQPVTERVPCAKRMLLEDMSTWRADMTRYVSKQYPKEALQKLDTVFSIVADGRNYADACFDMTEIVGGLIGADNCIIRDTKCEVVENDPCGWIISMCNRLHIDEYFCGAKISKEYLDLSRCDSAGVKIVFQDWLPPKDGNVTWLHYWFSDKMDELRGTFV